MNISKPNQSRRRAHTHTHLLDLAGEHAPLDAQHGGDVDVLPAHVVHPLGEAVHGGLAQHQRELDDVEHALDDVVCGEGVTGDRLLQDLYFQDSQFWTLVSKESCNKYYKNRNKRVKQQYHNNINNKISRMTCPELNVACVFPNS